MNPLRRISWGVALIAAVLFATPVGARRNTVPPPEDGGYTRSMGLTVPYTGFVGTDVQLYRPADDGLGEFLVNIGISRYLGNPTVGIAALGAEGYLGFRGTDTNSGGRLTFDVPAVLLAFGADYNLTDKETDLFFRLGVPVRRGGIVGAGSSLSLRYIPTRGHTFGVGLSIPLSNAHAGKTRPHDDFVKMNTRKPGRMELHDIGEEVDDSLTEAVASLQERARWIARLSQPFSEESGGNAQEAIGAIVAGLHAHIDSADAHFPNGHTLPEEIRLYHELLDRSFSIALTGSPKAGTTLDGRRTSVAARQYLLDHILFPYNYAFGQMRRNDTLVGLTAAGQSSFAKWLVNELDVPRERARACFWVFQTLCDTMEEVRVELRERWGDTRLVWMPLHYGFRADEHDTQSELNDILERATREEFAPGNQFWYVINEQFQWEMARSVRAAEDYHVLWIHDVAGVDHHGDPDELAYTQVVNYFQAMVERVKAYDDTGKLPMYIIFLDQHFYETNQGSRWMKILERPRDAPINLPNGFEAWEERLKGFQQELRDAVDESVLLRVEASQFGQEWLKNRIKVHVNITNPADPSFRSIYVMGILPVPDNNMRDHRKIIFYDVTEEDPYRGMAMFTGMGLGEHYIGPGWEDRAVMIQGPAALAVKDAARDLLRIQGFDEDEIPYPLRPRREPKTYDDEVDDYLATLPDWLAEDGSHIMQLHSETGFVPKPINVAKGVLYSLMPPGSVLKVPDSLWQSNVFASMLTGSAMRGCRVLVIAPTLASAPSAGAPQMSRAHGLMSRLLVAEQELDEVMDAAGGILKVGLFAPQQGVGDIAGRLQQGVENEKPWMDRVYDFHPEMLKVAADAAAQLDAIGYEPRYLSEKQEPSTPKLHLKANFFASARAWDELMARPEWGEILREYIVYLADQQTFEEEEATHPNVRAAPDRLRQLVVDFLADYMGALTEEEKDELILYLTVGSVNMDYRSQVMNGEVMITVAGLRALSGVLDFVFMSGLCEWPETQEELDELLPPPSWLKRKMADFIKFSL